MDLDLDVTIEMIYTCFVLHNFCEINNVDIHNDAVQTQIMVEQRCQTCEHHNKLDRLYSYNSQRGKNVRDK